MYNVNKEIKNCNDKRLKRALQLLFKKGCLIETINKCSIILTGNPMWEKLLLISLYTRYVENVIYLTRHNVVVNEFLIVFSKNKNNDDAILPKQIFN